MEEDKEVFYDGQVFKNFVGENLFNISISKKESTEVIPLKQISSSQIEIK